MVLEYAMAAQVNNMALKHVIEKEIVLCVSVPGTRSEIGRLYCDGQWLADDTVGPILDVHMVTTPEKGYLFGKKIKFTAGDIVVNNFVYVIINVLDASQTRIKTIYYRTLTEYLSSAPIYSRYRVPFKDYESNIHTDTKIDYHGNPDLKLQPGDIITVNILSPWLLDVKKSSIKLRFIEMLGHIGPEKVRMHFPEWTCVCKEHLEYPVPLIQIGLSGDMWCPFCSAKYGFEDILSNSEHPPKLPVVENTPKIEARYDWYRSKIGLTELPPSDWKCQQRPPDELPPRSSKIVRITSEVCFECGKKIFDNECSLCHIPLAIYPNGSKERQPIEDARFICQEGEHYHPYCFDRILQK